MSWLTKHGEAVSHLTKTAVKTDLATQGRFLAVVAEGGSPSVGRWAAVSGRTLGISQEVVGETSFRGCGIGRCAHSSSSLLNGIDSRKSALPGDVGHALETPQCPDWIHSWYTGAIFRKLWKCMHVCIILCITKCM